jgi:hypothetical protein
VQTDINKPGAPNDTLLTRSEAQKFLRVSRTKFFELLRDNSIACVRQARRRYFWRSDLVTYLNAHRIEVAGHALVDVLADVEAAATARERFTQSGAA